MRESTRLKIVRVLTTEMGIDPNLLDRDGANSDGCYVFVGKKFNGQGRLKKFVHWTAEQRAVIEAHRELFSEWFNDGVCCCCEKFSRTDAAYAEEEM